MVATRNLDLCWIYHEHFPFGWVSPRAFGLLLVVDWNYDTPIALIFLYGLPIFKTISRPKWTLYLKWVQPVVRTIQTPTCNGSGFSLNGHSAHFKCVPFETLTKDECQSQKIVINMKHMLRNHQILVCMNIYFDIADYGRRPSSQALDS